MKLMTVLIAISIFCFLLCGSQKLNIAQNPIEIEPKRTNAAFTDLTLEISTPTQSILSLQPIPLIIKQYNKKTFAVPGYTAIGFGKSPISVKVRKAGSDSSSSVGIMLSPIRKLSRFVNVELLPGEGCEATEWLSFGLGKHFPEPGRYELQAVLASENGAEIVESNTLVIDIRIPTDTDRQAFELIKNSSFQDFLFSGEDYDKVRPTLEALKARYPNSPYARSAIFVMGERYFVRKQFGLALANLARLEYDNDFIFAAKVRKYLAEIRRINLETNIPDDRPD